jgi:hypothetical protein
MLSAVTDDYFGTSATPPAGGPPSQGVPGAYPAPTGAPAGWAPPASPYQSQSAHGVTLSQSTMAAIGVAVAGLLTCVGAWGPWVRVSAASEGFALDFGGLHSGLDGKWVLALGVIAAALGVALLTMPSGNELRTGSSIVLIIAGIVGVVLVGHEYVTISDHVSEINGAVPSYLGLHAGSGWGLWLAGFGSAGVTAGGVAALLL